MPNDVLKRAHCKQRANAMAWQQCGQGGAQTRGADVGALPTLDVYFRGVDFQAQGRRHFAGTLDLLQYFQWTVGCQRGRPGCVGIAFEGA